MTNSNNDAPRKPLPRQARAIDTRNRLITAGRDAFTRLGHDGVNLAADILEPAAVSVGSFYHQFSDKTELLLVIMSESADARRDSVLGLGLGSGPDGSADPEANLRGAFERFFDSLDQAGHGWRLLLNERQSADHRVRRVILDGRATWIDDLTEFLGHWSDADRRQRQRVANALIAFAMGLAALYLDLPEKQAAEVRPDLIDSAVGFASIGALGLLEQPAAADC